MQAFPYSLVDLTHALSSEIPTWDGACGFEHARTCDYDATAEFQFRIHKIRMNEGIGTHMDAPAHCIPGAATIDQLLLSQLMLPSVVIDVSREANENFRLSPEHVLSWEKAHHKIVKHSLVLIHTGWSRYWSNPHEYRNNLHFPSVSQSAAELLLARNITGLGIDTLSPDQPADGFPVHKLLLAQGKYLVENAANLTAMPATGSFVLVAPLKIASGTEAPVRLLGFIPHQK